ncbi:DUF2187 family protein [Sutcliffiella sp. NPDC057660]|uniref:DUF2187 family protein n=1 Tax=Sutcliffiella sp. NPDC057660 TaxID=3346199 RepID=UPI0036CC97F7
MAKAKEGHVISFKRDNMTIKGRVSILYQNSAVVEISHDDAINLGYSTDRTVVNHKNYKILKS